VADIGDLPALVRDVEVRRKAWYDIAIAAIRNENCTMHLLLKRALDKAEEGQAGAVYDTLQAINDIEVNSTGDCTIAGDATEQLRKLLGIEED
jgi:hypothetical protein